MQLPYTDVVEEFKTAKARLLVTLDESEDPGVKGAGFCVVGERKTDTQAVVEEAEGRLKMRDLTGIRNKGKEGLGLHPRVPLTEQTRRRKGR